MFEFENHLPAFIAYGLVFVICLSAASAGAGLLRPVGVVGMVVSGAFAVARLSSAFDAGLLF